MLLQLAGTLIFDNSNASCNDSTAFTISPSLITVETLISDVLTILTWMFFSASTANISAATPGTDDGHFGESVFGLNPLILQRVFVFLQHLNGS